MNNASPEENARRLLGEVKRINSPILLQGGITWILITAAFLTMLMSFWAMLSSESSARKTDIIQTQPRPNLIPLQTKPRGVATYIKLSKGIGVRDDLWRCECEEGIEDCENITNSPNIIESWPVISSSGDQLAYYAISDSGTDLHVYTMNAKTVQSLTTNPRESSLHTEYVIVTDYPPVFSPNDKLIAFAAKSNSTESVEIFVSQVDGLSVVKFSNLEQPLSDFIWLDNQKMVVAAKLANGETRSWIVE